MEVGEAGVTYHLDSVHTQIRGAMEGVLEAVWVGLLEQPQYQQGMAKMAPAHSPVGEAGEASRVIPPLHRSRMPALEGMEPSWEVGVEEVQLEM